MVRLLVRGLAVLVVVAASSAIAVSVVVPRLAGATPYTVLTGSMRPSMPPGTLVVVRPVDPSELGIGSVVTYQVRSGEPEVVTHRVVEVRYDPSGRPEFRTRGDANPVADDGWVRAVQIRGARWYSVPYLGYAGAVLSADQKVVLARALGVLLVGYALVLLAAAARERLRHRARTVHG